MKPAVPDRLALARRLLQHETAGGTSLGEVMAGFDQALQTLRQHLAKPLGPAGLHALLGRALDLAAREFPFLRRVEVERIGSLKGLREAIQGRDAPEVEEAFVAVLASFIGLLVTFLGEDLSRRLLHMVWPDLPSRETSSEEGEV